MDPSSLLGGAVLTFLGHGTLHLLSRDGTGVLVDPWLAGNPKCPPELREIGPVDLVLITHGHFDHVGDAVETLKRTGATAVCQGPISHWLKSKGVERIETMNKGGTLRLRGLEITMTQAEHSSEIMEGGTMLPGGEPVGFVVRLEHGDSIYFAGDTGLFGGMAFIKELYEPRVAVLPIGDKYTMGPREAAFAAKVLGVEAVVPAHYGTFPALTGTFEAFESELAKRSPSTRAIRLEPGDSLR